MIASNQRRSGGMFEQLGLMPSNQPAPQPMDEGVFEQTAGLPPELMARRPSFGDRFSAWLHGPGTAAALFRSGAATIRDGLGAGLEAGAGYMDQQRAIEAQRAQQAIENAFKQQQLDQTGTYQTGMLKNDSGRIAEEARHNQAGEGITVRGQDITQRGQDLDYNLGNKRVAADVGNNVRDNSTRRYSEDQGNFVAMRGQNMNADTSRYVADRGADSRETVADTRAAAGIGSKAPHAPATMQKNAIVLPANAQPGDLTVGQVYRTARGLGQWDGQRFLPVQ